MPQLVVTTPIGSEWPTRGELCVRNAIESVLGTAQIGPCTGAGGGMGQMDLSYRVADEASARADIEVAMKTHVPRVKYSIEMCE